MEARIVRSVVLFVVLLIGFGYLQRSRPSVPGQSNFRTGFWLDCLYWFVTPLVSQVLSMGAIICVMFPVYYLLGRSTQWDVVMHGFGPVAEMPLWTQGLIAIVIGDFIGYWTHRMFHCSKLWDIHAVHHGSTDLDWLSAVRVHPINDVISRIAQASPVLLLGVSPLAVDAYVPFLSAYVAFIHANVKIDYGIWQYVIASPKFHRFHHTVDRASWGKNFSGLFPVFDLMFGTFYLPQEQEPRDFGREGDPMPLTFWGHTLYPFRHLIRRKRRSQQKRRQGAIESHPIKS